MRSIFAILWLAFNVISMPAMAEQSVPHISLGDNYGKHAMLINGEPAGIQKDLLQWFFKDYMKVEVVIESMPWKRAQMLVQRGSSDGYFTAYTRERVEKLGLIPSYQPFYSTHVRMHTWKGNPYIEQLSAVKDIEQLLALKQVKHVFLRGHGYHEENFGKAEQIHRVDDINQIPKFLLYYKRGDVFIEQSELFYPAVEEAGYKDRLQTINADINFRTLDWHLFLRPDSRHSAFMASVDVALERAINSGVLSEKVQSIFESYGLKYGD